MFRAKRNTMNVSDDRVKEFALAAGAFAASFLLKKILEEGYQTIYKEEPPNAIKDEEINWGKIIGWTIVSGVSAAAVRVLIRRFGGHKIHQ